MAIWTESWPNRTRDRERDRKRKRERERERETEREIKSERERKRERSVGANPGEEISDVVLGRLDVCARRGNDLKDFT